MEMIMISLTALLALIGSIEGGVSYDELRDICKQQFIDAHPQGWHEGTNILKLSQPCKWVAYDVAYYGIRNPLEFDAKAHYAAIKHRCEEYPFNTPESQARCKWRKQDYTECLAHRLRSYFNYFKDSWVCMYEYYSNKWNKNGPPMEELRLLSDEEACEQYGWCPEPLKETNWFAIPKHCLGNLVCLKQKAVEHGT